MPSHPVDRPLSPIEQPARPPFEEIVQRGRWQALNCAAELAPLTLSAYSGEVTTLWAGHGAYMGNPDGGAEHQQQRDEADNTEEDAEVEHWLFDLAQLEADLMRRGHITGSWPLRHRERF